MKSGLKARMGIIHLFSLKFKYSGSELSRLAAKGLVKGRGSQVVP